MCESFQSLLPSCLEYEYFYDCLIESSDKYQYNEDFELVISCQKDNAVNEFINKMTEKAKKIWFIWIDHDVNLNSIARFHKTLSKLEHFPIDINSGFVVSRNKELPVYTFSNITRKSNLSKISDFVAIDVETTGLKPLKDRITEISAIRFRNWEPVDMFTTLINPQCPIPFGVRDLTGITDDMVANSPIFSEIVSSLSDYIGKDSLVGHNLNFDLDFLYASGLDFTHTKRKYYDTLQLARRTYDFDSYKLDYLCEHLHIRNNDNAHRSSSDSLAAGILFEQIVKRKTYSFES